MLNESVHRIVDVAFPCWKGRRLEPPASTAPHTQMYISSPVVQETVTNLAVAQAMATQMAAVVEAVAARASAVPDGPLIFPSAASDQVAGNGAHTLDGLAGSFVDAGAEPAARAIAMDIEPPEPAAAAATPDPALAALTAGASEEPEATSPPAWAM